jgi:biotin carboxyl carrier protein
MEFEYLVDGVRRAIALEKKGDGFVLRDGDAVLEAEIRRIGPHEILVRTQSGSRMVYLVRDGDRTIAASGSGSFVLGRPSEDAGRFAGGDEPGRGSDSAIRAPMPGKVIKVNVSEGQEVRKNQSLLIVEAMKMENDIKAGAEGVVRKIHVQPGELVDSVKTLIELEPKA